jgi:hypothetical protein
VVGNEWNQDVCSPSYQWTRQGLINGLPDIWKAEIPTFREDDLSGLESPKSQVDLILNRCRMAADLEDS